MRARLGLEVLHKEYRVEYLLWSILALILTGTLGWLLRARPGASANIGALGSFVGCGLGIYGAGNGLLARTIESTRSVTEWNAPFASFSRGLDAVSALFIIFALIAGALVSMAALRRLPGDYAANRPGEHWFFLNTLLAAAVAVLLARNAAFFLFAWGTMLTAAFFLAESDQRAAGAGSGAKTFLITGSLGLACLAIMFALMGTAGAPLDFIQLKQHGPAVSAVPLLALVGFGAVMGMAPAHAGFADSYPRAPFQAAAAMSGIVGGLGVYGLVRVLHLLGDASPPPVWWGWLFIVCGLGSCALGCARAYRERDLWRFLARTSQTVFGFAGLGLGFGLLGAAERNAAVSFLGFASALFLAFGHSIAKPLLFLAAGSVQAKTGTREFASMGGLLGRMPVTGSVFLLGFAGIAAVPPLIGFWGALFLFGSAVSLSNAACAAVLAIAVAALSVMHAVGGWRVFRAVFLGPPKGLAAVSSGAERPSALLPHLLLAVVAVAMAVRAPTLMRLVRPAAENLSRVWWPPGRDAMRLGEWFAVGAGRHLGEAYAWAWAAAGIMVFILLAGWLFGRGKKAAANNPPEGGKRRKRAKRGRDETTSAERVSRGGIEPSANERADTDAKAGAAARLAGIVSAVAERMEPGGALAYALYMAAGLVVLLLLM